MFIAHAPSGYLLAQAIIKKCPNIGVSTKAILWVGIIGAVFPDIDMLYFYLIDHRQHHHHTYLTHWPISWLVLLVLALLLSRWAASKNLAKLLGIFAVAGFLHLMLDTLVGDVWWFAPWVDQSYPLCRNRTSAPAGFIWLRLWTSNPGNWNLAGARKKANWRPPPSAYGLPPRFHAP